MVTVSIFYFVCSALVIGALRGLERAPTPPPNPPPQQIPYFVSNPIREKHERFLKDVIQILLKESVFFNGQQDRRHGPFQWKSPTILSQLLNTTLGEDGNTHRELLGWIREVIKYSPHPSHPYMLDRHVAGLDPYALAADWLISAVNENGAVYYIAPAFVLIELEIVQRLGELFGWTISDGITTPGASIANGMAVSLALQEKYSKLKIQGLNGVGSPKVVMFVSELASPAFEKAALYQGLASNWVIKVKLDPLRQGRMDLHDLKMRIREAQRNGLEPFMVVGTAGTQDLGTIDNLTGIADVCKEFGLWFHVDADRGGPLIFSPLLRSKLHGIQHANSVTFGTWMLATPYVTSVLLVQGAGKLQGAFGTHAHYLFKRGNDLYNTSYDNGDSSVQASRRMEIGKLWYTLKARGRNGMAALVEKVHNNAQTFMKKLRSRDGFKVVLSSQLVDLPQVAFYYVPKKLRRLNESSLELKEIVSSITTMIKAKLLAQNLMQISTSRLASRPLDNMPEFFIASLTNSVLNSADFDYIMDLIQNVGEAETDHDLKQYQGNISIKVPTVSTFDTGAIESWSNAPIESLHATFFRDVFSLLMDKGIFFHRSDNPYEFLEPDDLRLKLNLSIGRDGLNHGHLLQEFEAVIKYSPHRGHPYFFFQLLGGLHPYTLAADWIASTLNTPMLTYEDSPVFTLMERNALAAMRKRIFGSTNGDGVITDGGSMANQMAITLALHVKEPKVRMMGLRVVGRKKFVGYMSQDAHYSTQKGFIHQSLGLENLVQVESDDKGRMRPDRLEAVIKRTLADGNIPFFVCITTGTTVYAAIDPVAPIVKLCNKYNLWCHVDGMVGGLLAMSDDHIGRLAGLEKVDSFGTDFHKLMGSTYNIAVLITRRSNIFRETFGLRRWNKFGGRDSNITDLYNTTEWDIGANHLQLDKRNSVFKLWFLWKAIGRKGFEGHVNLVMDNTAYLVQQLHKRQPDGFQPVLKEFDVTNVCFYYIPSGLLGTNRSLNLNSNETELAEFNGRLSQVSFDLEKTLLRQGVMGAVAQHRLNDSEPAFLKFVLMDSSLTKADIDYLLNAVAYYGEHLDG